MSQSENFALNVKSNKQKLRSHVEAVKGQFGFLSYEQDEGKKLFFHMSEVEGGEILQVSLSFCTTYSYLISHTYSYSFSYSFYSFSFSYSC